MNLSCGIVGLPNVGKSTLFNALLARQVADVANYPFCTIEPNTGIVEVPDGRLVILADIVKTDKIVPAVIKFVDIAGLVKGAAQGEGLGNKFLAHIRETDLIIQIVRGFQDKKIARAGSINPKEDYEVINTELCLADLETLEKQKEPKGKITDEEHFRWQVIREFKDKLKAGYPIRKMDLNKEELKIAQELCLITAKKEIVVLNVSENDLLKRDELKNEYQEWKPIILSAKLEEELIPLSPQERREYLDSLNIKETGLEKLIKKAFQELGLINFLTAGEKEVRAWTIKKGTKAPEAAGVVHTDFQKGFIRAAVVSYEDFVEYGGWKQLKEAGKIRFEGKDYLIQDGDVVEFYHN